MLCAYGLRADFAERLRFVGVKQETLSAEPVDFSKIVRKESDRCSAAFCIQKE